ncbi:MAG: hypothetical protein NTU89_00385 [Candidatus Dependentiae bacterium]|nr:hypothetical protein [Candidatus Dependentiae bacterium]
MSKIIMIRLGLIFFGFGSLISSEPRRLRSVYSAYADLASNSSGESLIRRDRIVYQGVPVGTLEIDTDGVVREFKVIRGVGRWCVLRYPDGEKLNINQAQHKDPERNKLSSSPDGLISSSSSSSVSPLPERDFQAKELVETFEKVVKKEFIDNFGRNVKITARKEGSGFRASVIVKLEPDYKVGNQWFAHERRFGWDSTQEEYLQLKNGTWKQPFRF